MTLNSLKKLDYPKIIEKLAAKADSEPGRKLCLELLPATTMTEAELRLHDSDDAVKYLLKFGGLPFSGINDIKPHLRRAENGAILNCRELLQIAALLRAVERLRSALTEECLEEYYGDEENLPYRSIIERIQALSPCSSLKKGIEHSIAGDDELYDKASRELMSIRRRIREAQDNIRRELDKILRRHGSVLQDSLITVRNNRYVVPVKSEQRSQVDGLVHDSSASGSTVYIEPMSVVNLNNKIRELEAEEEHEIERILTEFSQRVAEQSHELWQNLQVLAELDFIMAKGKLALDMKAAAPKFNDEGRIILNKARHPLIPADDVVPIDFELGVNYRSLVITGPNTGGKTVTLKTCGLLTLMAMAGLHIPARSPSEVSFFNHVLVDIGDEQSIEQSLSTFSSHIKEVIKITEIAGPDSLVLLDELGAGTDPSEGAALAIAILNFLNEAGCHTVATTHYSELKGYAMNTEGVENASCEFDVDSLQPTYRLQIGVPGVSHAFSIALKLGLDEDIIDDARLLLSEEGVRFEELVNAIEKSQKEVNRKQDELVRMEEEVKEMRRQQEEERRKLRHKQKKLLQNAEEEAAKIIDSTRREMEALIERAEKEMEQQALDHRIESELRGQLSQAEKEQAKRQEERINQQDPDELVPGATYEAADIGFKGILTSMPDAKGQVTLESGQISITVDADHLRAVNHQGKEKKDKARQGRSSNVTRDLGSDKKMTAKTELMLLGMRVDEALQKIDFYLDDAILHNISPVRIIHGKGTGALRRATQEFLQKDKRVKSYRLGGPGEGGNGVTIVELRSS